MDNWIGVRYKRATHHFAAFGSPADTKLFLAAIRGDEPGIDFVAFRLATGEVLDW